MCIKYEHKHLKHANLEESLFIKEPPNVRDDPRPCDKITAYVIIHHQIQVPLPKPCFLYHQPHQSYLSQQRLCVVISDKNNLVWHDIHSHMNILLQDQKLI